MLNKDLIPKGPYCFTAKSFNVKTGELETDECPYFCFMNDDGVSVPFCKYLNEGSISNNWNEEEWQKLEDKYGNFKSIEEKYPLSLLWDQVKSCGEKW
jgi:hypothetical protein